ncbi:hypothetical protein LguiA_012800 [Lonicera macranthoides]
MEVEKSSSPSHSMQHLVLLLHANQQPSKGGILFDDPKDAPAETIVSVYRINDLSTSDLSNFQNLTLLLDFAIFEYKLAGCMVSLPNGFTVVVVGGKREAIEKYRNVVLKHIKWTAVKSSQNAEGEEKEEENEIKKCVLLWEGHVAKPSFNKFMIRQCETEAEARKIFFDVGVTDYWDLAGMEHTGFDVFIREEAFAFDANGRGVFVVIDSGDFDVELDFDPNQVVLFGRRIRVGVGREGPESEELPAASKLEDGVSFYQTACPDMAKLVHIDPQRKRPAFLILFTTSSSDSQKFIPIFQEAAKDVKGEGPESEELAAASKLEDGVSFYWTACPDVAKLFNIDPQGKHPALVLKEAEKNCHFGNVP